MSWPVADITLPPMPIGAAWHYQSSPPLRGANYRLEAGWSKDVVKLNGDSVVPHLVHLRPALDFRKANWFVHADAMAAGTWNGPVGFANPRLVVGYTNDHIIGHISVTAPVTSFDVLVGAPAWAYDASVSMGDSWYRATIGSVYRSNASDYWQPSAYAAIGVQRSGLAVEVRGEQTVKQQRWLEAAMSYSVDGDCWRMRPYIAAGLTDTVGSPSVRGGIRVERSCKPVKSSLYIETPVVTVVDTRSDAPPMLENIELVTESPPVYPTPRESIGGFLGANPTVIVYIRTNLSETQTQRALAILQSKGLPMSQVERTDYVPRVDGEPQYLDFVVIKGNKNSEATDAPVEVVP